MTTPLSADRDYDAVCFDFGGVMISSPFVALHDLAATLELPFSVDDFFAEVFGPYHQDTDHPWHRIERGEMDFGDYFGGLTERLSARGLDLDLGRFASAFGGLTPHEHMIDFVGEVIDAGFRTALVTNNIAEGRDQWQRLAPVDRMDVIVDSSAVGMRKPNAAIYEHTLSALGTDAARTIFVDDAPGNIDGAAAVGMATVLVEGDGSDAIDHLRRLLGL